jgi:hypothetical protein
VATRIEVANVTVAALTLQAAPQITPFTFDDGRVDAVEIVVPDGPSGLVGFQIRHSKQVIIPYDGFTFITTNDEVIHWPLETFPVAQKWDVVIYNTDQFPHTLSFRWLITDEIFAPTLPPLVAIGT